MRDPLETFDMIEALSLKTASSSEFGSRRLAPPAIKNKISVSQKNINVNSQNIIPTFE